MNFKLIIYINKKHRYEYNNFYRIKLEFVQFKVGSGPGTGSGYTIPGSGCADPDPH